MKRPVVIAAALTLGWAGLGRAATIRGRVVAADGTPARGAQVWASHQLANRPTDRRMVVADDEGRFSFEVAADAWTIIAGLDDQGPEGGWQVVEVGGRLEPLLFQLRVQGRLRVRLVEAETGRPLGGAQLAVDRDGRDLATDADGRVEVRGLGRSHHHEAVITAPGRVPRAVLFEMADGPTTDLELELPRGGRAVGRVLDEAGRPVADASVSSGRSDGGSPSGASLWASTDEQERFDLDGLPLDRPSTLYAQVAGGNARSRVGDVRPALDGTPAAVEFRLAREPRLEPARVLPAQQPPSVARTVTGVVRGGDGRPAAAAITADGPMANRWIEARADDDGRFRVVLESPQWTRLLIVPDRPDLAPLGVLLAEGGDQDVPVTLPAGRTAAGVVRDDRGTPFAGVAVEPWIRGVLPTLKARATTTDARGRFRLTGLPDLPMGATFQRDGLVVRHFEGLQFDAPSDVMMSAVGVLAGRVVDPAGRPVRNFRVLLGDPREARPTDPDRDQMVPGEFDLEGVTFTAADGSFLIRVSRPGVVSRATVFAPGLGAAAVDRLVAVPSNQLDRARVATFGLAPTRTLRVHVVAAGTRASIADAGVVAVGGAAFGRSRWWPDSGSWFDAIGSRAEATRARTDATGTATLAPLIYPDARLFVGAPGCARRQVDWADGANDLDVPLEPEAVVAGTVVDAATGRPAEGTSLTLSFGANDRLQITPEADAAGGFRFDELPAGAYWLHVNRPVAGTVRDGQLPPHGFEQNRPMPVTEMVHSEPILLRAGEQVRRDIKLRHPPPGGRPMPSQQMPNR